LATGYWYDAATDCTVKHGGYKQVCLLKGANPTLAMVVDRFKEIKNLNHSRIELQTVYRDTLFSYEEGRF
jgi:DNA topoisomerase-3